MHNCTLEHNVTADIVLASATDTVKLFGCTYSTVALATSTALSRVFSTREQGVADAHKIHAKMFTAYTDTSTRHTASGCSWAIAPTNSSGVLDRCPAHFTLAQIAVNASSLVTIKCSCRRTNTGLETRTRRTRQPATEFPDDRSDAGAGGVRGLPPRLGGGLVPVPHETVPRLPRPQVARGWQCDERARTEKQTREYRALLEMFNLEHADVAAAAGGRPHAALARGGGLNRGRWRR